MGRHDGKLSGNYLGVNAVFRLFAVRVGLAIGLIAGSQGLAVAQDQGQFGKVIRIERVAFQPNAGLIGFNELPQGSRNPVIAPALYGGPPNGVTVSFAGFFEGQNIGMTVECGAGVARTGCVAGMPTSPLRLATHAPITFIAHDGSNPRSPSLSGSPQFNGPVTMLFDKDIAGIGLMGGYFNAHRGTAIRAFDRSGNLIGGVKNIRTGMEYLALVTEDGADRIAGVQFSLVGAEPAGFAIDDLSFAFSSQIDRGQVPGLAELPKPAPTPAPNDKKVPQGSLADIFKKPAAEARDSPRPAGDGGGDDAGSLSDLFK